MTEPREEIKTIDRQIRSDFWAYARWGANKFHYDNENIQWIFFVKGCHKRSKIIVTYDTGSDTYKVTYGRIDKNLNWVILHEIDDIYAENLVRTIDHAINNY